MAEDSGIYISQQAKTVQSEPQTTCTNVSSSVQPAAIELFRKEYSHQDYQNPFMQKSLTTNITLSLTHGSNLNTSAVNYYLNPDRIYDANFDSKLLNYMLAAERASAIYSALNITSSGMNMEHSKIFAVLRNANLNDIKLMTELYQEQFKRDINLDIRYGLKSDPVLIEHVDTLLKGEKVNSYASEIKVLLSQTPHSSAELGALLRELSQSEIEPLKEILKSKYALNLEKEIEVKFKPKEAEQLKLELTKDPAFKELQTISELIKTANQNPEPLIQYLRELSTDQLKLLKNLNPDISTIKNTTVKEIFTNYLEGNRVIAEVLFINRELKKALPDIIKIDQSIGNLSELDRQQLRPLYESKFGVSIENDIKSAFKNSDIEKIAANQLLNTGKIDDTSKIYLLSKASENNIQNSANLIKILDTKSFYEMTEIKNEVARLHNKSLDSLIANSLKAPEQARIQLDARIALYGRPETFEDEVNRVRTRYEFERIYLPLKLEKIIDTLLKKGKRADKEMEELENEHKKLAGKKEYVTEEEEIKFYNKINFLEKSLKDYEKTKQLYNSTIENLVGGFTALTLYIIANDLNFPLILNAILSISVFFAAKYVSHSYIKESIAIEQSLTGYKERRRNRKKSYFSKRIPGKRV